MDNPNLGRHVINSHFVDWKGTPVVGKSEPTSHELTGRVDCPERAQRVDTELSETRQDNFDDKFRQLLTKLRSGAIVHQDGRLVFVNDAAADMHGYSSSEVIGKKMTDFIAPEDIPRVTEMALARLRGEDVLDEYEYVARRKDNTTFPVLLGAQAVDWQGNPAILSSLIDVSDRYRANAAEAAEARFGRIIEGALNEVYVFDANTLKFLLVNRGARENLGYSMEELQDLTPLSIKPLFTLESFTDAIEPLKTKSTDRLVFETVHRRKDGSDYGVEMHLELMADEEPPVFVAVINDISEQKKTTEELRLAVAVSEQAKRAIQEREEKYRGVFDESVAAIYTFDNKKRFMDSNQAGLDLLGYSRKELLNLSIPDVDADPVAVQPAHQELLGGDKLENIEHRLVRKDGQVITVLNNSRPLTDAQGQVSGMLSTLIDITERKQAERQADAARRQLNDAIGSISEGFVLFDKRDRLVICNDKFKEIFAVSAEAIVPGATYEEILRFGAERGQYSIAEDRIEEFIRERVSEHQAPAEVIEQQLGDGRWLRIEECKTEEGGTVGIRTDVTDLKRALQSVINEKMEAESANKAKSEFLSSMSHELRTPMNGVLGMADLLLMSELPGDVRENIKIIKESGDILLSLLNDILDLSKIEAGKTELEATEVDVVELLNSVASLVYSQTEKKGLWCRQDVSDNLVSSWVIADPARIRQVLVNLVSNAIKFTREGGITLALTQSQTGDGRVETRFEVSDTGIGISKEQQGRIFEVFTQADQSTTRKYGGTGLGLSISRQLAELMGGQIGLASEPGMGSKFWLTIVSDKGTDKWADPEQAVPGGRARGNAPGGLSRLLVAEDNVTNQVVVGKLLDAFGFKFEIVSNGREAVDTLSGGDFDLVLMDINMPVLNGIEATRLIRALPGDKSNVPIIALTANAMKGDREKYLAVGMDDHVAKPVIPAQLIQAINRHTESTRENRQQNTGEKAIRVQKLA